MEAADLLWELDVDGHLVGDLGLAGPELAVDFGDRLRLDTAAEQVVDLVDVPAQLADLVSPLEDRRAGLEPADVGGTASGANDVRGRGLADVGRVRQFRRRGDGQTLIGVEACIVKFVCGRRSDAGEFLEI